MVKMERQLVNRILVAKFLACFILGWTPAPVTYADETIKHNNASRTQTPPALFEVISKLADFNTFYMSRSAIDSLFSQYCSKTSENSPSNRIKVRYTCDASTGLLSIDLYSIEHQGYKNYLMYLQVEFPYSNYASAKALVVKKLGRVQENSRNSARWRYDSGKYDKYLDQLGYPVIYVSREPGDKTATFAAVLEQDAGER